MPLRLQGSSAAALSATFARFRKPTVILFGDSRSANCDFADATNGFSTNRDWFGWGQYNVPTGPVFEVIRNSGVGGNTTQQMLDRFQTDVVAYAPTAMTLWGGTNDTWAGTADVDATFARMGSIMDQARAAGIYVFLISETTASTKGNTFPNLVQFYNERLRWYAATHAHIEFWDFNAYVINPTDVNGMPVAAMLADGLHPSPYGASILGQKVVGPALTRFKTSVANLPVSVMDSKGNNANVLNVLSNPLMVTTGGTLAGGDTGSLPGSWTSTGTPTAVCAAPARSDGFGNNLEMAITAASATYKTANQTVSAARLIAGSQYVIEASADIVSPVNLNSVSLTLQVFTSGPMYEFGVGKNSVAPVAGDNLAPASGLVLRSRVFTIPAGITPTSGSLVFMSRFGGAGSATVRLGRVALKKVTGL